MGAKRGVVLASLLLAGPAMAMPVQEAVRQGLAIHPDVRAAEKDEAAAGTDVKVAEGGFYPSVTVSGGPTNSGIYGASYSLTAAQMLYDWGHVSSQIDSAEATQHGLSQDLRVKRDSAALDIVATYLDVLAARQEQEADNRHIARLREILDMTKNRSQTGYTDTSEPARTVLELSRAEQQLAADKGKLIDSGNQFSLLVGEAPGALEEPPPRSVEHYVAENDLGALVKAAPLYLKAVEAVKVAKAQLDDAQATLLPQLNVEASASRDDVGGVAEKQSFIGLRFRMNTFQGFSNFQKVDGARQRVESAQAKLDSAERDLRREVQSVFDSAEMLRRQEDVLRDQVNRSADLSLTYQEQFRVGRRDVIDLLTLQAQRFQAERQLVDLHFQEVRAQYQAAAQLGLIGPLLEGELPL